VFLGNNVLDRGLLASLNSPIFFFETLDLFSENSIGEKKTVQQQDGAVAVIATRLASLDYVGSRAAHPKRYRLNVKYKKMRRTKNYITAANVVAILLLLVGWLPPLSIYADSPNQRSFLVVKRANGNWLPNTVLPDGASAFRHKGYWYSFCEGGLIRFDGITNEISVIPLPELKSEHPMITGIAIVNKTLWLSMQRDDGILLFNVEKQRFAGSIKTAKGTGFGEGSNVSIIQDTYDEKIWMSSFKHLDVYDIKTGVWENLDPVFLELGIGQPSSNHRILPDGDIIWINAHAHKDSRGGLIQIDLKKNKKVVFRKELVGSDHEPDRLDFMGLLSSPNFLWVYFHIRNAYNFYVAVYDKKNRTWKSYNRGAILPAIELLIKELPHVRWAERNFLVDLSMLYPSEITDIHHPYMLKPEQLKLLKSELNRLSETYENYNINPGYDNYGLCDYSFYNSVLYGRNSPWGEMKPIQKINITQIKFERLIGSTGKYVVLETNEGLGIFDPVKNTVQYLSPLTKLSADKLDIWWSKDKKRAIIRRYSKSLEDEEEYYDFKSLDFENKKIHITEKLDKPETKLFKSLPQNTMLIDNKEIMLQWDGLLVKQLKKDN
jgi:hypothetical protein